jgi:DNA-binding SARP family transcriptional activator
VADAAGAPLGGAAGQRRVLAFLSVLAVAGDAGLSRDKIAALLWPEADTDRARHSVTQALYASRRALGVDDLFDAGGDVRLNRARLASDVQEFERAYAAGELERAAELYAGPFLDGFFLPGSPEFEQWTFAQRARLEDRVAAALVELATRADAAGELREAVEWRKRLAALRPLDTPAALALMEALARAGDRAGAVRHAEVHGCSCASSSAWTSTPRWPSSPCGCARRRRRPHRAPRVRRCPSALPPPRADPVAAEPRVAELRVAATGEFPVAAAPAVAAAADEPPPWRALRGRWIAGALAVVLTTLVLTVGVLRREREPPPRAVAPLRQTLVVAPFRVAGASESLAYLRDGLVELLSARLADDSAARSVDAGAVLSAWRRAGLARDVDVPRDTVVRLAATLGAERVVIGSVVGTRSRAIFSATVVTVPAGAVAGSASVEGPTDSLTALVDRLAVRLLAQEAGEDPALAGQTTESLPALRAFLAAQAAFRGTRYDDAARGFQRALQQDSTFALAALQLVRSADRLRATDDRQWALALAWRGRAALSERDQALLAALAGPRFPDPTPAAELLAAWERPARLTPDRAAGWVELGGRLFEAGAVAGVPSARARAAVALRRALDIDASDAHARLLLAQLAAPPPGTPAEAPLPSPAALRDSAGPLAPFLGWRVAVARGDSAALAAWRESLPRLGPANLRAIAQAAQYDVVGLADARRAVTILRQRAGRPAERQDAAQAAHALALNEGRLDDAARALAELAELRPGGGGAQRLRVLDALYGDASDEAADAAARALATARPEQPADACVVAQWRLARGDTSGVARVADALRALPPPAAVPAGGAVAAAPPALCAELLDAALAVAGGADDAGARLARLDSLALTPATAGDAAAYAPILLARLHARLGDAAGALAASRRRAYMVGWPRYLATALREEGRWAALAGDVAGARVAWERHLALRAAPDAALAAPTETVRRDLAALAAAPAAPAAAEPPSR